MRLSPSSTFRPAFLAALCVLACVAGCASKNPLIDEPAAAAGTAKAADTASGVTTTAPTGVQRFLGFLTPYRVDIQQGNFISREMVAQLKESMQRSEGVTPEQVRFVLGTPLLTDMFHANRWDYVFRLKKRTGEVITSRVTAHFKDNRLVNIEGDTLPTEQEYLDYIAGSATQNGK
ncbi:MAG TPA: outer membrane protein assembly factor BamE [Noviherbaspirillum sp.]|uniref:outer membrane protein assembly factor BamE n=1 Tax=Noviherbaspirillum sp. TaxID=1926288 RepID=UPI002D594365|nr:outer membrane protein assembly factor BamE [Noviherbaspirillum sp.]HYD94346.1 outer membrane protein assembly factor BamE [Noviherbaspirillum sp.]